MSAEFRTEISQPTPECPHPERWQMCDEMSAEKEVLYFLTNIVELIKPTMVVETGTHLGISACAIGMGLSRNGIGRLFSFENNLDLAARASEAVARLHMQQIVRIIPDSSIHHPFTETIDLLFCDSDHDVRIQELELFWPNLTPQSVILFHDVNTGCHNEYRQRLIEWAAGRMAVVFLPTPRGLAICQKL